MTLRVEISRRLVKSWRPGPAGFQVTLDCGPHLGSPGPHHPLLRLTFLSADPLPGPGQELAIQVSAHLCHLRCPYLLWLGLCVVLRVYRVKGG